MEWWQELLIAVIPAVITAIVTVIVKNKSQLSKNTEAIKNLTAKIGGKNSEKSLCTDVTEKFSDIVTDIGRGGEKSLTNQHKDILDAVTAYENERKKRLENFTKKQKDVKKKIEEVSDFLEDWEKKIEENEELKNAIKSLQKEINSLQEQNSEFNNKLDSLEKEKTKLNRQIEKLKSQTQYSQSETVIDEDSEKDEYELEL